MQTISGFLNQILDYKTKMVIGNELPPNGQREFFPYLNYNKNCAKKNKVTSHTYFKNNEDNISLDRYRTNHNDTNLETLVFTKNDYSIELTIDQFDNKFKPIIESNNSYLKEHIKPKVEKLRNYNLLMISYELLFRYESKNTLSKGYSNFKSMQNKAKAL
jgi:hypothetical protein